MNNNKIGLLFAMLVGGLHLLWSLLVFLGWGQIIFNFIFWAHMIKPMFYVSNFDLVAAVTLVICTTIFGYIFGYIASVVWNKLHSEK